MASKRNCVLMKVDPEFRKWLEDRRMNLQKLNPLKTRLSIMDTTRIIARTKGIDLNEAIKSSREMNK